MKSSIKLVIGKIMVAHNFFSAVLLLALLFFAGTAFAQSDAFITTWKTDNPGTSNSTSITVPTTGGGYNYDVDWDDDGTYDQTGITGDVTHDYGTAGTYTIRIRGAFPRIYFNGSGDREKLLDISQWGTIAWTSMEAAFLSCVNLNISATDVPNLSGVTSMASMFFGCSNLDGPANIGTWNTGAVTNMRSMFFGADAFNKLIGTWNTAAVTDMTSMFFGDESFNQDLGAWVLNASVIMSNMLTSTGMDCANYSATLIGWSNNPLTPSGRALGASGRKYETAAVAARDNLTMTKGWTITDAGLVSNTFYADTDSDGYGNAAVSGSFNTCAPPSGYAANTTDCDDNCAACYPGAPEICDGKDNDCNGTIDETCIPFISTWKTDNPGTSNSTSITIPTTGGGYNYDVDWDDDGTYDQTGITGDVTHDYGTAGTYTIRIRGAFPRIYFNGSGDREKLLDISQWGTIAWTSMEAAFLSCVNLDISATDVPNLSGVTSMASMFFGCSNLDGPANIGTWNTGTVTNMRSMFFGADAFNKLIGTWNTAAVTDMTSMFFGDESFNQNLGAWVLNASVIMNNMLTSTGMDCANYSATLIGWSNNPLTPSGRALGASGRKYETAAVAARDNLTMTKGWTITGDGLVSNTFYADTDGDGYGNAAVSGSFNTCAPPSGYAANTTDCDDNCAACYPGAPEICDGKDNDCNGTIDDVAACGSAGTRTWTGLISTDWHTPCNWNPGCVPTADDDVIIPNVANDPSISAAAVAKSVIVNTDGVLTVDASGSLTINGSTAFEGATTAFGNNGTVHNNGTITIGSTITLGLYGLHNRFVFNNNTDGQINIDRPNFVGLFNQEGTFNNAATITIGATPVAISMDQGLWNEATFNNNTGGQINIDRTSGGGLNNSIGGIFTNAATITIGAVESVGNYGVNNYTTFNNNTGGQITIDRTSDVGLYNQSGTFNNAATITIGANASVGNYGIRNKANFNNNTDGQINIDRPNFIGLYNEEGTFNNAATITIGATPVAISMDQGLWNEATFNNNTGGQINIDRTSGGGLNNSIGGIFTNAATITIGAVESVGNYGVKNYTTFNNNMGGQINIDRPNFIGLYNEEGTFNNAATITIGATPVAISMDQGLWNSSTFNNNTGGQINIDRTSDAGLNNSIGGTFTNAATITIGAVESVGNYGVKNYTTFNNNACAEITTFYPLFNSSSFTNAGLLRVNTASAHTNTGTFTNDGIIEYPQGNPIPNVVNNEITVALTTANTCDVVSPAFGLGNPLDFTIVGIFTDAAATMSAGTYTVATNTFTPTSILAEGTYTYYVKIEDSNGGCTRIATWKLITENCCDAPEAICKSATIVLVGNSASLSASDVNNGSTYECGLQSMTVSPNSFGCSHVGAPQTVTLTVTDVRGDSDHCTATVMVLDNTPPSITCPAPMMVSNTSGQCGAYVTYAPTVSDNCSGATFTVRSGPVSGSLFPVGTTAVQLQAADATGLTATCDFTVRVHDMEQPNITCPNNIIRYTAANACGAVVAYTNPTYTDNCPGAGLDHLSGGTSGSTFPVGTTNVVWMATDAANNTRSCSFSITVTDTQVPTITCPANMMRPTTTGQCAAQVTFNNPTASDNCAAPTLQWVSGGTSTAQGPTTSTGTFAKGTTTVQWKATDAAGLIKTCTFRVIVNDTEAPTMSCPAGLNVNAMPGQCGAAVTYSMPTYTDNCAPTSGTAVRVSGPPSGSTFSVGTTNVVFRATDAAGNTRQCTLTVTVVDNQPPTISCPPSLTVTGNGIPCTATVVYTPPTASDNCAGLSNPYLVSGLASGSVFPVGITVNTWLAMDLNGVTAQCAFTVTVNCPTTQPTEDRVGATSGLWLMPNPAATEVTIAIQGEKEASGTLSVYDATGRLVWEQTSAATTVRLDVSAWPSGVYAVSWRQGKTILVKRLAVTRG